MRDSQYGRAKNLSALVQYFENASSSHYNVISVTFDNLTKRRIEFVFRTMQFVFVYLDVYTCLYTQESEEIRAISESFTLLVKD